MSFEPLPGPGCTKRLKPNFSIQCHANRVGIKTLTLRNSLTSIISNFRFGSFHKNNPARCRSKLKNRLKSYNRTLVFNIFRNWSVKHQNTAAQAAVLSIVVLGCQQGSAGAPLSQGLWQLQWPPKTFADKPFRVCGGVIKRTLQSIQEPLPLLLRVTVELGTRKGRNLSVGQMPIFRTGPCYGTVCSSAIFS